MVEFSNTYRENQAQDFMFKNIYDARQEVELGEQLLYQPVQFPGHYIPVTVRQEPIMSSQLIPVECNQDYRIYEKDIATPNVVEDYAEGEKISIGVFEAWCLQPGIYGNDVTDVLTEDELRQIVKRHIGDW